MLRHKRPKQKDQRRELTICVGVLALFGGLFVTGWLWSMQREQSELSPAQRIAQLHEELRHGPILFVPTAGNVCRQRVIDNETWRIRDGGHVVCDEAVSWNATVPLNTYSVTSRVQALRSVFTARQGQ